VKKCSRKGTEAHIVKINPEGINRVESEDSRYLLMRRRPLRYSKDSGVRNIFKQHVRFGHAA
jgi:hypothetical protein